MAELPRHTLRIAELSTSGPTPFELTPPADARQTIAAELGLNTLRKLRFVGQIAPSGAKDWSLTAELGATVVQNCVITLDPVTTRIDEPVTRTYVADLPEVEGTEVEMPEDDTVEPLPQHIDLTAVMIEALSLALPAFPKSPDAELGQIGAAAPGVTPMTDDDAKPFAGLQSLRDKLADPPKGDDG